MVMIWPRRTVRCRKGKISWKGRRIFKMQTTEQSKTLAKNYNAVKENIKKACEQAGRSQEEVTLLAVSKTKPVDMLMDVYHAGARDF